MSCKERRGDSAASPLPDLTEAQWALLAPLVPAPKPGGRPAVVIIGLICMDRVAVIGMPRCGYHPAMHGFDGEPAFRLRWQTERDDIREAVAWDLRHSRRLKKLRVGYGLAVVLFGLGAWLEVATGEPGTVAVAAAAAVAALVMVATLPARLRRRAWRATSRAPKELLVYADGLLLSRDATQLRMPWSEFTGMDETPRLLLLTLAGNRPGLMFPKRGLGEPAAIPRLREYLAARVGSRPKRADAENPMPNA